MNLDVALIGFVFVLAVWTAFVYWYGFSLGHKVGKRNEAERWKPVVETTEQLCSETLKFVSGHPNEGIESIARLSAKAVGTMMDVIAKWPR